MNDGKSQMTGGQIKDLINCYRGNKNDRRRQFRFVALILTVREVAVVRQKERGRTSATKPNFAKTAGLIGSSFSS
jgi:hypothetical protein